MKMNESRREEEKKIVLNVLWNKIVGGSWKYENENEYRVVSKYKDKLDSIEDGVFDFIDGELDKIIE